MSHHRLVKGGFKAAKVGFFSGTVWAKQKLPILLSSEVIRDLVQETGEAAVCC